MNEVIISPTPSAPPSPTGERDFREPASSASVATEPDPNESETPRVLGRLTAREPGPSLILVGGIHGNEPAGVLALERVFAALGDDPRGLDHGRAVALAGNLKALARRRRYLEHDFNRHWLPEQVARLRATREPLAGEDEELRELDRELEREIAEARGPVYLLDIHTTSGPELPFATLDDTLPNRAFAFEFPVPVVVGLEEELSGTLASYLGTRGAVTAGFEAGQHQNPRSVDRAADAIWIALEAAGLVARGSRPEVASARRRLAAETRAVPHVVEVRYRHPVEPDDWFRMDPGYVNFQRVEKGQTLAVDRTGPVKAPESGMILMPLYQTQGADGFFLVRRVRKAWLELSAAVRRLRLERYLHWLPGVERDPQLANAFVVDLDTARWLARELFHLLGFRRHGEAGSRRMVMMRRPHDTGLD